jgi:hypothetical protein
MVTFLPWQICCRSFRLIPAAARNGMLGVQSYYRTMQAAEHGLVGDLAGLFQQLVA